MSAGAAIVQYGCVWLQEEAMKRVAQTTRMNLAWSRKWVESPSSQLTSTVDSSHLKLNAHTSSLVDYVDVKLNWRSYTIQQAVNVRNSIQNSSTQKVTLYKYNIHVLKQISYKKFRPFENSWIMVELPETEDQIHC